MAKTSTKARDQKRLRMIAQYAEKRAAAKEAGDSAALQKLPRNSSPSRRSNRCGLSGRKRGYMRDFGISRIDFRELANKGMLPGVRKSSW